VPLQQGLALGSHASMADGEVPALPKFLREYIHTYLYLHIYISAY
jgi:hypothetical protein